MNKTVAPSLTDVLKAAGVDKVIWIDDDFAEGDPERQKLRIQELIGKLHSQKINPQHKAIAEIVHTMPEGVREAKIQQILADKEAYFVEIIESLQQQCPGDKQEGLDAADELTPVQISALKSALANVETMSHKGWTSKKSKMLPECTERTLFLIDRQFSKEGLGEEGDEIVKELKGQGKYHCIMLTRTKPEEGTELLRNQIVTSSNGNLKLSDFSVMCKSQIGKTTDDAKREFCQALRVVFTHRHCHKVAKKIGEVMKRSIDITIEQLVNHSVYDLDQAIYANSLDEGASELDVITRILLLEQRVTAQRSYIVEPELIPQLGQLRVLRSMTPLSQTEADRVSLRSLHKWKREEMFDEGDIINKIHSPLNCGDVFQVLNTNKRFLLLVQPCDVATRGATGERKAKEGIFVAINDKKPKPGTTDTARRYEIEHITEVGYSWFFDFLNSACVSLSVLEFSVFNSDGLVQISKDQQPKDFWLPGWKKRFQDSLSKIKALDPTKHQTPKKLASLSLNENLSGRDGSWHGDNKTWGFNFQRIGRIRSPYAEAILGSFAAYHTRAAFDHDFAYGLWPAIATEVEEQKEHVLTPTPTKP